MGVMYQLLDPPLCGAYIEGMENLSETSKKGKKTKIRLLREKQGDFPREVKHVTIRSGDG